MDQHVFLSEAVRREMGRFVPGTRGTIFHTRFKGPGSPVGLTRFVHRCDLRSGDGAALFSPQNCTRKGGGVDAGFGGRGSVGQGQL